MTPSDPLPPGRRQPLTNEAIARLALKDALTLPEAEALGYGCERLLRQMIRSGRIKRAVLSLGSRGVRLQRSILIEELQQPMT